MTNLEKYKIICKIYKDIFECRRSSYDLPWHTHHIKPKSIYPELKDDEDNKVELPAIVHAAAHHFLSKFAEETDDERFKKITYADVVSFINENIKNRVFSFDDGVANEIFSAIADAYRKLSHSLLNLSKEYEKDRFYILGFSKGCSLVNVSVVNENDIIDKQLTLDEVNTISEQFEVYRCCFHHDRHVNTESPLNVEKHKKYLLLSKYPYCQSRPLSFNKSIHRKSIIVSDFLQKELDSIFERHSTFKKDILDLDVSLGELLKEDISDL